MSNSVKLIREQKEEYMDHMFDLTYEFLYNQYKTIYQNLLSSKEAIKRGILKSFQKEVAKIPEWNQLKVEQLYQTFLDKKKCAYFHELLKTVYILSVKLVLLGLPKENRNKIQIKVPSPESYLHRLMIHIAREIWKRPFLFYHQVKSVEHQNHLYQFELIVRKKIRSVIRETLPMDLMVQYMSSGEVLESTQDTESESETEESAVEDSESEENDTQESAVEESETEESESEESAVEESEKEENESEESGAEESEVKYNEIKESDDESVQSILEDSIVEPIEPTVEEIKPTVEPIEPTVEETKPTVEPIEPTVEETKPTVEPTVEETKPTVEPIEPTVEEIKPTVEPVEPTLEETKPIVEPIEPIFETNEEKEDEQNIPIQAKVITEDNDIHETIYEQPMKPVETKQIHIQDSSKHKKKIKKPKNAFF